MNKTQLTEIIREVLSETIRKVDGKYVVYPKHGGDRLGTHDTREKALAQLRAIEASKHEEITPADPSKVDPHQLKMGIKVEMEHTNDLKVAARIALQHLAEDPQYYTKLTKAGLEEREETINFDLKDIQGKKVVLATYGKDKVGALRLKPYQDSYQVDSVIVKPDYRGYGIGKEMYRLAHEKLGPLYSDARQTPEASALWSSLIKSGEAKKEGDRFVMIEGPHDAMNPGILSRDSSLKGADGKIKISKVRAKLSSMKDKGSTKAKALRRFINYHD